MTREEPDSDAQAARTRPPSRVGSPLPAAWRRAVEAAGDAGDRLAAHADPDTVPLPVVRLPSPCDEVEHQ